MYGPPVPHGRSTIQISICNLSIAIVENVGVVVGTSTVDTVTVTVTVIVDIIVDIIVDVIGTVAASIIVIMFLDDNGLVVDIGVDHVARNVISTLRIPLIRIRLVRLWQVI